jgi:hypothetical protein
VFCASVWYEGTRDGTNVVGADSQADDKRDNASPRYASPCEGVWRICRGGEKMRPMEQQSPPDARPACSEHSGGVEDDDDEIHRTRRLVPAQPLGIGAEGIRRYFLLAVFRVGVWRSRIISLGTLIAAGLSFSASKGLCRTAITPTQTHARISKRDERHWRSWFSETLDCHALHCPSPRRDPALRLPSLANTLSRARPQLPMLPGTSPPPLST